MSKLLSVSMRNFLSYGNDVTTVSLERTGTTLIVGEDLDNVTADGVGGNGVGKSTLINAIAYGLYDKPVSDISKDNLVNWRNQKNMEVIVEFVSDNGNTYKVHRQRKMKSGAAGNNVYLYENGEDITLDSAANTNQKIEDVWGIPHELFVRIVVFSATHIPFLDLPSKEQTDIIEELFGLTMISEKAVLLKELIKSTETKQEMHKVRIASAEKEHERLSAQIASAQTRVDSWNKQNAQMITSLTEKLASIKEVDIDAEQELHTALSNANGDLQKAISHQSTVQRTLKDLVKHYTKSEGDLTHLRDAKCPYCLQQYGDAEAKITETVALSAELFAEMERLEAEFATVSTEVDELTLKKQKIKRSIKVENLDELLTIKSESDNIARKIDELKVAENPYLEPLAELLGTVLDEVKYDDINELSKIIEHQKFLLKLLTKKDSFVRKTLLNTNIPYLNSRMQHYLSILGLPHKVEFTKEMTAKISQFGLVLNFGNLSQGQRARVNIALSFAFKDVLQNIHKKKINICMLDEILDHGLDAVGVQAAARLVKQKGREDGVSMYIISHRHDQIDNVFDHKITVQLAQGFSHIKEE